MKPDRVLRAQKVAADLRAKVSNYLKEHPCVDCDEKDIVVLEFDHIDSTTKIDNVSTMITNRVSWSKILKEINKCEVRCANCHRRKTAKQFGYKSECSSIG